MLYSILTLDTKKKRKKNKRIHLTTLSCVQLIHSTRKVHIRQDICIGLRLD